MFINSFEYFTFSCLNSSLNRIEKLLQEKLPGKEKYSLYRKQEFTFDLYQNAPRKGGTHFPQVYFFVPSLKKDIVVMVSNYSDGWSTLVNYISSQLSIEAYKFRISALTREEPFNSFCYVKNGKKERTVYAMKDGKWVFYKGGDLQPFEDDNNYRKRIIRQRLNNKILVEYCKRLGFEVDNDKFWESREVLKLERMKW